MGNERLSNIALRYKVAEMLRDNSEEGLSLVRRGHKKKQLTVMDPTTTNCWSGCILQTGELRSRGSQPMTSATPVSSISSAM